jgi:hypothetical protein
MRILQDKFLVYVCFLVDKFKLYLIFYYCLEDLRNPHIRNKLWDIYQKDNVKKPTPLALQTELKRLQLIDKKLKQYYKESPDYNRTIDHLTMNGREPRPSIPSFRQQQQQQQQQKTDDQNNNNQKRVTLLANNDPSNSTTQKMGRFHIENVNETK